MFGINSFFARNICVNISSWRDGQEISAGVHVVSGPISLTEAQTNVPIVSPQLTDFSSFTGLFNYPKCRPSQQPMPELEPVHTGVLSAEHVDTISQLSDVPDFTTTYQVIVLVRSTRNTASLPMHATLDKFVPKPLLIVKFLNKLLRTQRQNWLISGTILLSSFLLIQMMMFVITRIFPQESLLMLLQL